MIWTVVGISFLFLVFRLFSRFIGPRTIYWDDVLIILAWILSLVTAIIWSVVAPGLYTFYDVVSGHAQPGPSFVTNSERYYTGQLTVLIFFYTALWSVKFSFLMFFRRLRKDVDKHEYLWWTVFAITAATYVVCIGTIQYKCLASSLRYIEAHHCSAEVNIVFTLVTLKVNCALDILTDSLSKGQTMADFLLIDANWV